MSLGASASDGGSVAVGIIIWVVVVAAYWSPTIVGALMHKHNLGVIAVWNFFGFFFLFPFVLAWVKVAEKPQMVVVQHQGYSGGPWTPPPGGTYYDRPPQQ